MSSRIIIKNLPKYINEKRLKEKFEEKGEVTDVKLLKTQDGISRRFAFIGYKTEEQARFAVKYFNNTYIDTCKIIVDLSKPCDDSTLPRPWSKYSKGSSAYEKRMKRDGMYIKDTGILEIENKAIKSQRTEMPQEDISLAHDSKFEEFLELSKPRAHSRLWANEDGILGRNQNDTTSSHIRFDEIDYVDIDQINLEKGTDDNLYEDLQNPSIGDGKPNHGNEKIMNLDEFLNEKMKVRPQEGTNGSHIPSNIKRELENLSPEEILLETGRLFVRNLPYSCTEDDLRKLFEPFGPLTEIHLSITKDTKKPKGFAYILYMIPENALKAYRQLDGKIFQGRLLHILAGMPKREIKRVYDMNISITNAYKKKHEEEKKKSCDSEFNWNSLFMSSDAVAESMAARMKLRKSELLDLNSQDIAVRLALAETQVISETKQYLENEGVYLDSFSNNLKKERSKTCILVKNIPYTTQPEQLFSLFGTFGDLNKVILPPTKTIAIIDFADPNQAKLAFKTLAYTKFKDVPMYLEWAPIGIFVEKSKEETIKEKVHPIPIERVEKEQNHKDFSKNETIDNFDDMKSKTLFVKNLSFNTTDETFKKVFEDIGELRYSTIVKKNDPKHPGKTLSMGYGFVEYRDQEDASKAFKLLQVILFSTIVIF
jgi:multiple RNA-binding domain-containing protein 1